MMQGKRIPPLEGHSVEVAYINGNESDVMNEIIGGFGSLCDKGLA